jgi:hypothetical protein
MTRTDAAVAAVWASHLVLSAWGGWADRVDPLLSVDPTFAVIAIALPLVFFPAVTAAWPREDRFARTWFGRWIDGRVGAETRAEFLAKLRLLLLVCAGAIVSAVVLLLRVAADRSPQGAALGVAFYLSGAAAFALAHWIARRRGVSGL